MAEHNRPVLVMEARDVTPNTRNFRLSDTWSRLYRLDDYFLDLSYHSADSETYLHGQVLTYGGELANFEGQVSLLDTEGQKVVSTELHALGQFKVNMHPTEIYQLIVYLKNDRLVIPALSSS